MTTLTKRLDSHFVACAAVAAAAAMTGGAKNADAAIVWSGPVNIVIPSTTQGVYLNVVTGINAPLPAGSPGWDVNPYASGGLGLFSPTTPSTAYANVAGQYNLAPGTAINAGSTYGNPFTTTGTWNLNSSNNLVGFRFQNEANGNQVHYGWMRISLTGGLDTQPRAIVEYAYENQAGVGINAGQIPAPGAMVLLGMAGLVGKRRRRN